MIKIEKNKSSTYFLPIFNKIVPIKYFHLLENSYFWYDSFNEETFCLLYRFSGKIKGEFRSREGFVVYEQELRKNENYIGEMDYGEYVIYKFNIPEELIQLKYTLLNGKYSHIPEEFKQIILSFITQHYGVHDATVLRMILYRDPEYREQLSNSLNFNIKENAELTSIIDIEKELFSNHIETSKTIKNESKNNESWGWNPWTPSNKSN